MGERHGVRRTSVDDEFGTGDRGDCGLARHGDRYGLDGIAMDARGEWLSLSPLKSVSPKAVTLAIVAFGEASIARLPVHWIRSDETGDESIPTPKKVLEKVAMKFGRSFFSPAIMPSNTDASTPFGLSAVLSM